MDITKLQYFKIIAEYGSLTKAAKTLHISQPAMSAMLKKFEEELDVELFERSANRIHLNQMYENTDPIKLLAERTYDLVVTPCKIRDTRIQSLPFLADRVFLSLPGDSKLLSSKSISLKDIPHSPFFILRLAVISLRRLTGSSPKTICRLHL